MCLVYLSCAYRLSWSGHINGHRWSSFMSDGNIVFSSMNEITRGKDLYNMFKYVWLFVLLFFFRMAHVSNCVWIAERYNETIKVVFCVLSNRKTQAAKLNLSACKSYFPLFFCLRINGFVEITAQILLNMPILPYSDIVIQSQ